MAVAFRSLTSTNVAQSTSGTCAAPSGLADGDILVYLLYIESSTTVTWPSGFVQKSVLTASDSSFLIYVAWKRAASESGSYAPSWATSEWRQGVLLAISGAIASGDPFDVTPGTNAPGSETNTLTCASITTATDAALIIAAAAQFSVLGATPTAPSGHTLRFGASGRVWAASDALKTPAGSTGSLQFTGASATGQTAGFTIALKPATAPARSGGAAIIIASPAWVRVAPLPAIIAGRPRTATRRAAGSIIVAPALLRPITTPAAIFTGAPRGATTAPVSASDTGTVSDLASGVAVSADASDAGALADASSGIDISGSVDTGAFGEASAVAILQPVATSDGGSLSESVTVDASGALTDTGALADASALTQGISRTDTCSGVDASALALAYALSDAGAGIESASVASLEPAEYRLFEGVVGPAALSDTYAISLALEFYADQDCEVTKLHYWRGASDVPSGQAGRIYQLGNATPLASVNFSDSGTGWQTATLGTPLTITGGQRYYVVVYFPTGRFASTANYFDTGAGASGINNGVIHAPNDAGAAQGQMPFSFGIDAYPYSSAVAATFYWVDVTIRANVVVASVTDAATFNEAIGALVASATASDSGALNDVSATVLSSSRSDAGALADASTLLAASSVSDSGSLSESSTLQTGVNQAASDVASVTDTAFVAVSAALSDAGALADSAALQADADAADSGTFAEAIALLASATASDSGALNESIALQVVRFVAASDAGALAEAIGAAAMPNAADAASGADTSVLVPALARNDAGASGEACVLDAALSPVDAAASADAGYVLAACGAVDAGVLAEAVAGVASAAASDAGTLGESVALSVTLVASDAGAFAELVLIAAVLTAGDSGASWDGSAVTIKILSTIVHVSDMQLYRASLTEQTQNALALGEQWVTRLRVTDDIAR